MAGELLPQEYCGFMVQSWITCPASNVSRQNGLFSFFSPFFVLLLSILEPVQEEVFGVAYACSKTSLSAH